MPVRPHLRRKLEVPDAAWSMRQVHKLDPYKSHTQDYFLFPHLIALKCLTQSFHLKTGAKQREQATHQYHPASGHQEKVGFPAQLWKMPENGNGK